MHMFRGRVSHDLKRVTNALVTKSELIRVEGSKKGRGRPKITSIEVIKSHLYFNWLIPMAFRVQIPSRLLLLSK